MQYASTRYATLNTLDRVVVCLAQGLPATAIATNRDPAGPPVHYPSAGRYISLIEAPLGEERQEMYQLSKPQVV